MIAARMSGGPTYPEMIEEMGRELNNVIEDFNHAVYVEALHLANETSKLSLSQSVDGGCSEVWRRASGVRVGRARVSGVRTKHPRAIGVRVIGVRASRMRTVGARASRSRSFIQVPYACQDRLSPQIPLYGQHLPISSQSNHRLGLQ